MLKDKLAAQIPGIRNDLKALGKAHGDVKISDVSVAQAYGGMRGVKGMICDTSVVEPDKGLIIRGTPILDIKEKLPEEIFWLLLTGELPNEAELKDLQAELTSHYGVPEYVWNVLAAMPKESHPMAMLDTAILVLEHESEFRNRYATMAKTDYWDAAYDDALKILGMIPNIAAGVYRMRYDKGARIEPDTSLDWAANYVHMLGLEETPDCYDMMRLYLTLHSDHEGGNVSANTCHTVGSALSDPFYAVSAGLNGLAGPLHGLANQECLGFVLKIREQFGGVPTKEELTKACWDLLNSGQVIPGYGHAVLRVPDPRFVAFHAFGAEHCAEDEPYQIVDLLFQVAPEVLKEHGKAKNPWPNVDAGSGALLYHYGLKEFPYYTVLFSVSRAMGMLSQLIINRAIGTSITRPKSVSTEWIKTFVSKAAAG
jgi:citrate synthase